MQDTCNTFSQFPLIHALFTTCGNNNEKSVNIVQRDEMKLINFFCQYGENKTRIVKDRKMSSSFKIKYNRIDHAHAVIDYCNNDSKNFQEEKEIKRGDNIFFHSFSSDTRISKGKTNLHFRSTYLQKTFQTLNRVLRDHLATLVRINCSECCWVSFVAVVVAFAPRRSLFSILALQIPKYCQRFLSQNRVKFVIYFNTR